MIDLHTHVLPRVDDGPENIKEAVQTVSALVSGGTEVIVATPHNMPGRFETGLKQIMQSAEALRDALASAEVPIKLLLGQEITFQQELLSQLERGELLTINETAYFLFEFSPYSVPPGVREFIFQARLKNFIPVLAHPERNQEIQDDIEILEDFVKGGIFTQLTAASILGRLGEQAQRASRAMLKKGLVHIIATDSHSFRFGPGDLAEAVEAASEIIGKKAATDMVTVNPAAVVEGRPLEL